MPKPKPKTSLKMLASSLDAEIVRLQRCRGWIRRVDPDLLQVGRKVFSTDLNFARWLSTPLAELTGRAPIEIMYARDGQSLIHGTLLLIAAKRSPRGRQRSASEPALLPEVSKANAEKTHAEPVKGSWRSPAPPASPVLSTQLR
jgi:hypothetical protein